MIDFIDNTFWLYMVGGTAVLYGVNWMIGQKKHTVYRISNDSLSKSKQVMIRVLNLVEDGKKDPIDRRSLPFKEEHVKSAAKILAYYYLKKRLPEDYHRVKQGYISLSRFQESSLSPERQEAQMKRDARKLANEFNIYIKRSPACEIPGNTSTVCAEEVETVEAKSEPKRRSRKQR